MRLRKKALIGIAALASMAALTSCAGSGSDLGFLGPIFYFVRSDTTIVQHDEPTDGQRVVINAGSVTNMRLSPDRSRLLYISSGVLHVVDVDGSNDQALPGFKAGDWNGDGSRLMVVSNANQLHSMNPDGTNLSASLFDGSAGGGILNLDVNPSGDKIAMTYVPTGWARIFTIDMDGTDLASLTADGMTSNHPRWSPDGVRIAFDRAEADVNIYAINDDGTNEVVLANTSDDESLPAFRTNGTIIYTRSGVVSDGLWTMSGNGSGQTSLHDTGVDETGAEPE